MERREGPAIHGFAREALPSVVRQVDSGWREGFIEYSDFSADEAPSVIAEQVAFFERVGQGFEWKVYAHDEPSDLRQRLGQFGFEVGEEEALMILRREEGSFLEDGRCDVRRITEPSGLADVAAVQDKVWPNDRGRILESLAKGLVERGDSLGVYVAYVDGQPASSAWMSVPSGSQFAGLWGGSTIPEFRGRGLYRALIAARAREARRMGAEYLRVDALPTSRPILERLGFQRLSSCWACCWRLGTR